MFLFLFRFFFTATAAVAVHTHIFVLRCWLFSTYTHTRLEIESKYTPSTTQTTHWQPTIRTWQKNLNLLSVLGVCNSNSLISLRKQRKKTEFVQLKWKSLAYCSHRDSIVSKFVRNKVVRTNKQKIHPKPNSIGSITKIHWNQFNFFNCLNKNKNLQLFFFFLLIEEMSQLLPVIFFSTHNYVSWICQIKKKSAPNSKLTRICGTHTHDLSIDSDELKFDQNKT